MSVAVVQAVVQVVDVVDFDDYVGVPRQLEVVVREEVHGRGGGIEGAARGQQ